MDDKGTAGQSPDLEIPDDANPVTDTTTIDGPDNGDRRRRPHDDARVIPIPEVDSDSKTDLRQNDDDKTAGVERSGGDAGVEASGLVNSDGTVEKGQGDDAGVGAMVLINSDSGRTPDGLKMSLGLGSRIQSAQATWWPLVNWREASGLMRSGRSGRVTTTRDRYLPVLENWIILESAMDREVTHAISTTE